MPAQGVALAAADQDADALDLRDVRRQRVDDRVEGEELVVAPPDEAVGELGGEIGPGGPALADPELAEGRPFGDRGKRAFPLRPGEQRDTHPRATEPSPPPKTS